jgi:uncharacterized protein YcfJ
MLKLQYFAAAAAVALAACAGQPASYDQPRYASSSMYNGDYDRVVAIDVVRGSGGSSGAGAVIGGIVGGVLGHQVGNGRGNDAATVAGAVGGAVVGNEMEKRHNDEFYRVRCSSATAVRARSTRTLYGLRVGDRVHVDSGRVIRD